MLCISGWEASWDTQIKQKLPSAVLLYVSTGQSLSQKWSPETRSGEGLWKGAGWRHLWDTRGSSSGCVSTSECSAGAGTKELSLSCSEGSPEARAGPTTKMWYFCALKQTDCVQIRDFDFLRAVFQCTLFKQGFKNTLMETTKAALAWDKGQLNSVSTENSPSKKGFQRKMPAMIFF